MLNQKTYRWFGRSVGDYPLPAGFKAEELGKCEHAIRIPGDRNAYEIGVVKRRDGKPGFQLIWDFWQGGYGMEEKVGKEACRLRQEYSLAVPTRIAKRNGYQVTRTLREDGHVILRATN